MHVACLSARVGYSAREPRTVYVRVGDQVRGYGVSCKCALGVVCVDEGDHIRARVWGCTSTRGVVFMCSRHTVFCVLEEYIFAGYMRASNGQSLHSSHRWSYDLQ